MGCESGDGYGLYVRWSKSFNQPLEKWDVSQVTDMAGYVRWSNILQPTLREMGCESGDEYDEMFYKAESFNQPLEKWDVSKVTNMS